MSLDACKRLLTAALFSVAFGLSLTAGGGVAQAVHNCSFAEIDEFDRIFLTLGRTRDTCRNFLVRMDEGTISQADACRACNAARDTERRLNRWFDANPVCAADLHADEINEMMVKPLSILEERCGSQ